jgi:hypothetical protein
MADAFDAHICLACRTLVTGLENYVAHIKECRVRPKTSVQNPSVATTDLETSAANNLDFSTIQNLLQNLDSENGSVQERHESTAATTQVRTNGVHNNLEYFGEKHHGEDVSNLDEDVDQTGSDGLSLTNEDNLNSLPKPWQKPDSLSMSPSKATTAAYNVNDDTTGDCGFEDFISFLGLQTSNNKTADDMDFMASKRDLDAINADLKKGMQIAQLLSQWDLSSSSEEEDEEAEGHSASPAQAPKYDKRPRKLPTGAKWKPGMLQKKGKATTAVNSEVTLQAQSLEQEKTSLTLASSSSHYSLRQNRNPSEKGLEVVLSKLRRKVDAIAAEAARDESSQSEAPEVVNTNSADDVEEVEESEYHEYECKPCKLKFQSLARKNQHYRSQRHRACIEKSGNDKDGAAPVHAKGERSKLDLKCPTCDKTFGNKQSFVKHLLSIYHKRRMRGEESGQVEQAEIAKALLSLRPYQCRICAYYVTERQEFFDHIKSDGHSEAVGKLVGSLWCRQCKCVCSDVSDLVTHFDAFEHSTEQPWCVKEKRFHVTCKVCGKEEHSASRLQYHMQVHHSSDKTNDRRKPKRPIRANKSLTCRKCDRTLSSAMSLENHMKRKHASDEDKRFACQFCSSAFIDAQSLKSHEKSEKHLNRMVELGGNQMSKLLPAAKPNQVDCVFCAFKAQMPIELRDHYRNSHANMIMDCVPCGIVCVTTTQWEKHVKMGRHRKRVEYYEHYLAGHGTMQSCDECGQCFYTNLEFRMHQMSHHTILSESLMAKKLGGGSFYGINARYHNYLRQQPKGNTIRIACPSCGKMLQRQYLLPHLRAHSGSQPFVCVQCQATFSNSMSLRRHIKMLHVARTSIICEHCGRAFNNRMKLALHKIRTHKDQTTERSYKCDKCDRVFVQPCQLKCHALIHGEKTFPCTFPGCQRAFRSKGELVVHLRVHNDERPFLCEQCSYAARTRQQLVRHQRTHTGERRYNCEYCDYKVGCVRECFATYSVNCVLRVC